MTSIVELEDGRQASYQVLGDGEPLLYFVGGPGLPASMNLPDAELLQERFAVYLIDPHGSGGSSPPVDQSLYDHFGHAAFYEEVRRALGLERVSVGGISFGGVVALTYAARFPEAVRRCLVVSSLAMGEEIGGDDAQAEFERNLARHAGAPWYGEARSVVDQWTDRVLATNDPAEVEQMLRLTLPLSLAEPDRPEVRARLERLEPLVRADLAACKAWESGLFQTIDLRPLLPDVRCRTLVIAGELDFLCGPAHARVIARGVPNAEMTILDGCGHIPSIEQPEAFKEAVVAWLARA